MKTKLQQHIESTPITDPTPTVAMPKQPPRKPTLRWLHILLGSTLAVIPTMALKIAGMIDLSWSWLLAIWIGPTLIVVLLRNVWLRAFLPLFALVAVASADTIFTDIYGNVIGHVPWPVDHDIYVPVPTIGGPAPWLRPPPATPTPKPATPVPVYHPWKPL